MTLTRLTSNNMSTDETLASRLLGEYGDNEGGAIVSQIYKRRTCE